MKLSATETNILRLITRYGFVDGALLTGLRAHKAVTALIKKRLIVGENNGKAEWDSLTYRLNSRLLLDRSCAPIPLAYPPLNIIVGEGILLVQSNPFRGINPYDGQLLIDDCDRGFYWEKYKSYERISGKYLASQGIPLTAFVPNVPNEILTRDFVNFSREYFCCQHMSHTSSIGIVYYR